MFNIDKKQDDLIIVFTGEGGTGKTTIATSISNFFGSESCQVFEFDRFAIDRNDRLDKGLSGYNLGSFFLKEASNTLKNLFENGVCWAPEYNHTTGKFCRNRSCGEHVHIIKKSKVNLIVGVPLWCSEFSWLNFDKSYFFEFDSNETRRFLRIKRDITSRGFTISEAKSYFDNLMKDLEKTIFPSKKYCDCHVIVTKQYQYFVKDFVKI